MYSPPYRKKPPIPLVAITESRLDFYWTVLANNVPGFLKQSPWIVLPIAQILLTQGSGLKRHKLEQKAMALNCRYLSHLFAHQKKELAWVKETIIKTNNYYDRCNGICKAWRVRPELECALLKEELSFYPNASNALCEPLFGHRNRAAAWRLNVPNFTPVDLSGLYKLRQRISAVACEPKKGTQNKIARNFFPENYKKVASSSDYLLKQTNSVIELALLGEQKAGFPAVPLNCNQSVAGRYYASGLSLQNVSRIIRSVALKGMWESDIDACHHQILAHFAQKNGIDCPALYHYIECPKVFREYIAAELGVSYSVAKLLLILIMYGAGNNKHGEVYRVLGKYAYQCAQKCCVYLELYEEIQFIGEKMVRCYTRKKSNGVTYIVNACGLPLVVSSKTRTSQMLSHLLQGQEAILFQVMVDEIGSVVNPEHDGGTAEKYFCPDLLEQRMFERTSIQVSVTTGVHN